VVHGGPTGLNGGFAPATFMVANGVREWWLLQICNLVIVVLSLL